MGLFPCFVGNIVIDGKFSMLYRQYMEVAVEQGLGGVAPGSPATYIAMGHLYFDSVEAFQTAFGPHSESIMGDIPNFTDIQPTVQISEVKM